MSVHEKMTAIANAIRRKTGGTEPLTLDQMATEIDGISAGGSGGSMFTTKAVGIIPDIPKGYGNSAFTVNFESSAIGSLS